MKWREPAPWILLAAAAPRLWAAWFDHGIFWPDEIYQSLEQAHRVVFGVGFVPWEFQDGARSWLLPGLFAVLWRVAAALGMKDSLVLVATAKTLMALISLVGLWAAMRLAARLAGRTAELLTGALGAFLPPWVALGSRALPDPIAATLVVLAALGAIDPASGRARWWRSLGSGVCLGLALVLRPQCALFAVALPAALLLGRRREDALTASLGTALALGACGVLDVATWHDPPFAWLVRYARYLAANARRPEVSWPEPAFYYPVVLARSVGLPALTLLAGLALDLRRRERLALWVPIIVYLGLLSLLPHKEIRYALPALPLGVAVAGAALGGWIARSGFRPWSGPALAALVLALSGWSLATLTCRDLGFHPDDPEGARPPWHLGEGMNLALHAAGRRPDLCGLAVGNGPDFVFTGGYSYFHRPRPLIGLQPHAELLSTPVVVEAANYQLAAPGWPAPPGFVEVEQVGGESLRRRDGPCVPHPELDQRLFEHP